MYLIELGRFRKIEEYPTCKQLQYKCTDSANASYIYLRLSLQQAFRIYR